MNQQEFESLRDVTERLVSVTDLQDRTPRTLLYGYTCDRMTFHVYLDGEGVIHRVCYDARRLLMWHTSGPSGGVRHNNDFVPDKRLYPESCDYEFCVALARHQVSLPFTTFDTEAHAKRTADSAFAGLLLEQLTPTATLLATDIEPNMPGAEGIALLKQAASELGAAVESAFAGVCVDSRHVDDVLARAKVLRQSEEFQLRRGGYSDPEQLAQDLMNDISPFQSPRVFSANLSGGVLTAQYDVDTSLDFDRLAAKGYTVETLSDKVRRIRAEGVDALVVATQAYRQGSATGFLLQRLFGEASVFERFARPFLAA